MKTLLLLRHAKSDWSDPHLGDRDRPLNKRGKRDAPRVGRLLRDEDLMPDLIITSIATRARQTVEALVRAGNYTGKIQESEAVYLAAPDAYVQVLRGVPETYPRVMVVGHNPGLEDFVTQLSGVATRLPTSALAQIDLSISHWRDLGEETTGQLVRVWRPREAT